MAVLTSDGTISCGIGAMFVVFWCVVMSRVFLVVVKESLSMQLLRREVGTRFEC